MDGLDTSTLEAARACIRQRAWSEAFDAFTAAENRSPLDAEDLERLALCAGLLGHDEHYLSALERAHDAHVEAGRTLRGARCAFWIGLRLLFRGEMAHATGWLTRAERLTESVDEDCAERGYLLLPAVEHALNEGDWHRAHSLAAAAIEIGERFAERDLSVCARHLQGRALIGKGDVARGLALLDECMVAVAAQRLSPIMTGLVYCGVIETCQQVHAVSRAREWTFSLARWCDEQPEMVAFTGTCLVHRAEIMQLHGAWTDAIEALRRACERNERVANRRGVAAAFYQAGEVHRLRGEFAEAEDAYRSASGYGRDPQPGLALLRLAQGRTDLAATAIRRAIATAEGRIERFKLLPAYVEIMLAAMDLDAARLAGEELECIAAELDTEVARATAAHALGELELAGGNTHAALSALRRAAEIWQELDAPYPTACARVSIALACRALGDEDTVALELDAARTTFEQLEAAPDLARVASFAQRHRTPRSHGLTRRELQVLRMLATGKTNRCIASELFLSEKTIDRHVSNIFAKLSVPSRAAATAYAYRHQLL